MIAAGQVALLVAFISSGYAAFACIAAARCQHRAVARSGALAGGINATALTIASLVLAYALAARDFRVQYVAQYCHPDLPWYYCLSAFWVGQAGSLLLWAWFLAIAAVTFRFRTPSDQLGESTFGILMAYVCFLSGVMAFAADPLQANLGALKAGGGLSPVLRHPAMLIHPPVVFLGYAGWSVPFALALAALIDGRLDDQWVRRARSWSLFAWSLLGIGILLGGYWAYEELGWGGYWSWDPVENASLLPWLVGTALIHCLMAWEHRGALKKTSLLLSMAAFALCNFATFLTRSGLFSSLHEFGQSPLGWLFLTAMLAMAAVVTTLVVVRRAGLRAEHPPESIGSREAQVLWAVLALVLLTAVTFVGTLSIPLSAFLLSSKISLGQAYYNNVLIPTGLFVLSAMIASPLLRWGSAPTAAQQRGLRVAGCCGIVSAVVVSVCGVRHPVGLYMAVLAAAGAITFAARFIRDFRDWPDDRRPSIGEAWRRLTACRRPYAGYLIHAALICLAIGVTGSSLGSRRHEAVLREGDTVQWGDRAIRYARLQKHDLPDRFVAQAQLEVSRKGGPPQTLLPERQFYRAQGQWSSKVAIRSQWGGDFYAVLHGHEGEGRARFTFMQVPLMRWLWLSGGIIAVATVVALWPAGRPFSGHIGPPAPKGIAIRARRTALDFRRRAR